MSNYDNELRVPMVIVCGHTLCSTCIQSIRSKSNTQNEYSCPFCMHKISKDVEPKKNWEILPLIKLKKDSSDLCEEHYEDFRFVCLDCNKLICHICLYDFHTGHKIDKSDVKQLNKIKQIILDIDDKFKYSNFESDTRNLILRENSIYQKCLNNLKSLYNVINTTNLILNYNFLTSKENYEVEKYNFEYFLKNKPSNRVKELNNYEEKFSQINSRFSESTETIDKSPNNITPQDDDAFNSNFLKKKRSLECNVQILENLNSHLNKLENSLNSDSKKIIQKYEHFKDIKKEDLENYLTNLDYRKIKYKYSKSPRNNELFDNLQKTLKIDSQLVIDIFKSIDRKDFSDKAIINPYEDKEIWIGFNATMPTPNHCLRTLNHITQNFPFKKGIKKILDIGSGSGYFTLCLSKYFGPNSLTYGIDHIQEILNLSTENINKSHSNYLKSERIKFNLGDGRDGIPEEGPFDIIHFGISHFEIPPKIVDQLAVGGLLWIALGPKNETQQLTLAKKEENGTLTKTIIAEVKFKNLMEKEEQLKITEDDLEEDEYV
jgi:protein-L-isoaspartate(D-aspartate) O-methyltransferase